jgi:SAM-dependent methyltransferase
MTPPDGSAGPAPLGRPCPVCAATSRTTLRSHTRVVPDQFPQARSVEIVACAACGMVFADPAAPPDAMDAYYASQLEFRSDLFALPAGTVAPEWHDARLARAAGAIADRLAGRRGRILDVGCGSGALLAHLRDMGLDHLAGVDPSPAAVAAGRSIGLDLHLGTVTDLPAELGAFDLVVLSHVVEHLADPGAALDAVRRALRPEGLIYIEVPDAERLAGFVRLPFLEFSTEHVNYFSGAALSGLAARHGLECVGLQRSSFLLMPGVGYPAVSGFFRAGARPDAGDAGASLARAMLDYVARCDECVAHIDRRLDSALGDTNAVAVRGMGDLAWTLLATTRLARLEIVAYLDASPSKQRLTIDGHPVQAPDLVLPAEVPVILLSLLHEESMIREIRAVQPGRLVVPVTGLLPEGPPAESALS